MRIDYAQKLMQVCDHGQERSVLLREVARLLHVQRASIYGLLYLAELRKEYPDVTKGLGTEKAWALSKMLKTPRYKNASEEDVKSLVSQARNLTALEIRKKAEAMMDNAEKGNEEIVDSSERGIEFNFPPSIWKEMLRGKQGRVPARDWILSQLRMFLEWKKATEEAFLMHWKTPT